MSVIAYARVIMLAAIATGVPRSPELGVVPIAFHRCRWNFLVLGVGGSPERERTVRKYQKLGECNTRHDV
jgi:hypothetical protein